jgi:hypothetical protein
MMNDPIPFAALARNVGEASAEVLAAAQSTRSEFEARFGRVRALAVEARRTDAMLTQWFRDNRDRKYDPVSEDYVRAEVGKARLIRASLAAKDAYHAACDSFFLNADERTPPGRAA